MDGRRWRSLFCTVMYRSVLLQEEQEGHELQMRVRLANAWHSQHQSPVQAETPMLLLAVVVMMVRRRRWWKKKQRERRIAVYEAP